METAVKVFLLIAFGLPGFAALLALALVFRGYILSVLWGWFIVPGFGAPPISIALAIGLSIVAGVLSNHRTWQEVDDPKKKWHPLLALTFGPCLTLCVGWIAKQYL